MSKQIKFYLFQYVIVTILFEVLYTSFACAGNVGNPNVVNFPEIAQYTSRQNWSVTQDRNGIMYFANTGGMLEFDGKRWQLYHLPGQRGLRTVDYHASSDRIYCGSFEEFGYWQRNTQGELHYYSLSDSLPANTMHNDEIWSIAFAGDTVYFRSFVNYYVYHNNTLQAGIFPSFCLALNQVNAQLYAATHKGIYAVHATQSNVLPHSEPFSDRRRAQVLLAYDDRHTLIATTSKGLYLYDGQNYTHFPTEADELLGSAEINRAVKLNHSTFVFGTLLNGMVAIDTKGKQLWHINKSTGLSSNTVLGLCVDREGNVWTALDNGIDCIETNSDLRFYLGDYDNVEAVYAIAEHEGRLYLGTNTGVFYHNGDRFTMLPETRGQVWDLSVWDGHLLCGHNNGTFEVKGNRIRSISNINGGYCLRAFPDAHTLLQSTYTHLVIYKKTPQGWQFSHSIPDFVEPVRYIEIDHLGNIWAAHLEKGIFKICLSSDLSRIEDIIHYKTIGGQNAERIGVFKVENRIVFTKLNGLYTYNDIQDSIVPYENLNRLLGKFRHTHRIMAGGEKGHYWLACKDELALVSFEPSGKATVLQQIPQNHLKIKQPANYENVYVNRQGLSYIGLSNGFAIKEKTRGDTLPAASGGHVLLRAIEASDKERHSEKLPLLSSNVTLPARLSNLKFSFAYPSFSSTNVQLMHKLEGFEQEWSPVSSNFEKEYLRLPAGKYTFMLQAIDEENNTVSQTAYDFTITPAWYATGFAYLVYLFLICLLLAFAHKLWNVQLKKRQTRILEQEEEKIIRLKNEQLEAEVIYKGKELAGSAMAIIEKNNILLELKKELQKDDADKISAHIKKLIDKNLSSHDEWSVFQANFDLIHDQFFRNLKKRTPALTAHDLRLCAYLRLNLSTKEIAQLMGNSIRGVEVARYRLRKKLKLPTEQNLNEFMLKFKGET